MAPGSSTVKEKEYCYEKATSEHGKPGLQAAAGGGGPALCGVGRHLHVRERGVCQTAHSLRAAGAETVSKVFLRDGGSEGKGEPGWPDSTPHGCQGQ